MPDPAWLMLVHQLPPKPLYLRAQVRRRLAQVGAIAVKNSVYVLPDRPDCLEDFQWIAEEAVAGGGDASICRAEFVHGLTGDTLRRRFQADADARFAPLKASLERLLADMKKTRRAADAAVFTRLRQQIDDAGATDFFNCDSGHEVRAMMKAVEQRQSPSPRRPATNTSGDFAGCVWVTRRGPKVDRLATAWLIRRFVDPAARFRFVDPEGGGALRKNERSFDMVGADFTHEGDRCSFETMIARLGLSDPALVPLAQIVHDLDVKDGKFGRADALGIQKIVEGLAAAHPDSLDRISAGLPVFDALFASFGGRTPAAPARPRRARKRAR